MLQRHFSLLNKTIRSGAEEILSQSRIKSWVANNYGSLNELELKTTRLPIIQNPGDVLIKVHAASINPIDKMMLTGYGRNLLNLARQQEIEFPLILGRDFSGTVISKGKSAKEEIQVGDEVYGFVPLTRSGTFSECTLTDSGFVQVKPDHLSHREAASMVYAGLTAWSALYIFGNLCIAQTKGTRVLVLGGSGGVGTLAIQLLKSQGCVVATTCSKDAIPLVQSLNVDYVFDYKDSQFEENLANSGKYHIVLDCAKMGFDNLPQKLLFDTYITLNSPLLINTDQLGIMPGLMKSLDTYLSANLKGFPSGKSCKWGFVIPSSSEIGRAHV